MSLLSAATGKEVSRELLWLQDEVVQATLELVDRYRETHSDILLGSFMNYANKELVLVHDPAADVADVRSKLKAVVDSAPLLVKSRNTAQSSLNRRRLTKKELAAISEPHFSIPGLKGEGRITITLRPTCRTKRAIRTERQRLERLRWHPNAKDITLIIDFDARISKHIVTLPMGRNDMAKALHERFNDEVIVEFSDIVKDQGRYNDGQPHYGGAQITNQWTGGLCTAGFAMDKNGGRWMSTAGHCAERRRPRFWSGNRYYGVGIRQTLRPDAMLIGARTQLFSRIIHTTPCCPSTRLVTGTRRPYRYQLVCHSGSVSQATCGGEVERAVPITVQGRPIKMFRVRRNGGWTQGGDSGGPIYVRLPGNRAVIVGMHVGRPLYSSGNLGLFHSYPQIERAMRAKVATACCNATSW